MKKKIFSILLLISILFIFVSSTVLAETVSSEKATFEVVEKNKCRIDIKENAYFEKELISYDLDKKEVTIGLKVVNNSTIESDDPCEVVLLIDNSSSMNESISTGNTRMSTIINSAKTLTSSLFTNPNIKMSVVSFSSANSGGINYEDPNWVEEGNLTDAKLIKSMTNNKNEILSAITSIGNNDKGDRTNIQAGLRIASNQFTGTIDNKYIVLLSDGIPNLSIGVHTIIYDQADIDNTKSELQALELDGINIITMLSDSNSTGTIHSNDDIGTYGDVVEAVFGTELNPTAGKFYHISDSQIEETVTETILGDLTSVKGETLRDIDIYDYFPQDIVNNFNFEYVQEPTKGTVSEDIDLQTNSILWHIDELKSGETATLSYKLKLKDNIDSKIIKVILDTNEKVDITTANVVDENGNKKVLTSDKTPKVRVNLESTPKDETVAPTPIPQTGTIIFVSLFFGSIVVIAIVIGVRAFIKGKKMGIK